MTEFVAVDGEADAQGRYILLCDSLGRVLHDPDGITTLRALTWLLELRAKNRVVVCYGLNYDVNQWIADLTPAALKHLVNDGVASYRYRYELRWIPNKFFTIRDCQGGPTLKVCEVVGFFQTTFVKALKAWGLPVPAEIETMKRKRGTFTAAELERVKAYCLDECTRLVQLMEALEAACDRAGCLPARGNWIGAGSLAATLLRTHGVKESHEYDAELGIEGEALASYFGGRVELLAQGVASKVHVTDVRSAYPSAAMLLPALQGVKIRPVHYLKGRDTHPFSLWRVSWEGQEHNGVCPFPVRTKERAITYPRSGSGTYHAVEVSTAFALGYDIKVHGGIALTGWKSKPFEWIPAVFAERVKFQRQGHAAEKALKLALNSVYGKLAQGYGFGGRPPFQSFYWAGYITACTRAKMLQAAHTVKRPLMISTDGLFSADPPPVKDKAVLGGWELSTMTDALLIQPGVYVARKDGVQVVKSRGFSARDLDWNLARQAWDNEREMAVVSYVSRRFIGARSALHRNNLALWRTWPDERRTLNFETMRKNGYIGDEDDELHVLRPIEGGVESVPYVPKGQLHDTTPDDDEEAELAEEQPHHAVI